MGTGDDDIYFIDYTANDSLVSFLDELDSSYQLRNDTNQIIQNKSIIESKWENKNLYFDFDSDKLTGIHKIYDSDGSIDTLRYQIYHF